MKYVLSVYFLICLFDIFYIYVESLNKNNRSIYVELLKTLKDINIKQSIKNNDWVYLIMLFFAFILYIIPMIPVWGLYII